MSQRDAKQLYNVQELPPHQLRKLAALVCVPNVATVSEAMLRTLMEEHITAWYAIKMGDIPEGGDEHALNRAIELNDVLYGCFGMCEHVARSGGTTPVVGRFTDVYEDCDDSHNTFGFDEEGEDDEAPVKRFYTITYAFQKSHYTQENWSVAEVKSSVEKHSSAIKRFFAEQRSEQTERTDEKRSRSKEGTGGFTQPKTKIWVMPSTVGEVVNKLTNLASLVTRDNLPIGTVAPKPHVYV